MQGKLLAASGPVTAVLGPTNTGKTHLAVERMLGHESGMIGLPLRLLAREIYDRIATLRGAQSVALITGEEKIAPSHPNYYVCTVEAMPMDIPVSFLAVDEIQLAEDLERGHIFTHRLLYARGLNETMFLGAETMRPLIKQLIPQATFVSRPRFSDLSYAGSKKLSRLPRRTAIVAFSAESVYGIAELIRRQRGGAAVVMGALSPRTRNAQVALYQSGDVDFMVATDAIGMGLNMDVDHVAFASLTKFDGVNVRTLKATETAQIAGRAGRYLNDGTFGTTADAAAMDGDLVEQIENHRFDPVRVLQWRNDALDFDSLQHLIESLEKYAPHPGLVRTRPSTDLLALRTLASQPDVTRMATSPAAIRILWDVCVIPDFRKVMSDEHARILSAIYGYLMSDAGQIPDDWLAKQVQSLDRVEGDLDTIANRISHIRTWTFVSNRSGWVENAADWRERTREIEDKLSDALHDRLTQRFIDRRTGVLMKRLRDREELMAAIDHEGEVTVEGEYVGRLMGFRFVPDPRAQGIHGKALRAAASRALTSELAGRATELSAAPYDTIQLSDTGKLWWRNAPVARIEAGAHWLSPPIELMDDEALPGESQKRILKNLQDWFQHYLATRLGPLLALRKTIDDKRQTGLTGLARGIGYRLVENFGLLERARIRDDIRSLSQSDRAQLRRLGVRFGEFSIYVPKLLKPAAAHTLVLLWKIAQDDRQLTIPMPPPPGRVSVSLDQQVPKAFYAACGYRPCGARAVRVDMLERLAEIIRTEIENYRLIKKAHAERKVMATAPPLAVPLVGPIIPPELLTDTDAEPNSNSDLSANCHAAPAADTVVQLRNGEFVVTARMMSHMGCGLDDMASILHALGFRRRTLKKHDGDDEIIAWRRNSRHVTHGTAKTKGKREKASRQSPFAVLGRLKSKKSA